MAQEQHLLFTQYHIFLIFVYNGFWSFYVHRAELHCFKSMLNLIQFFSPGNQEAAFLLGFELFNT
ncbi:hypothetical protein KR49_13505 [Synechococcus sp. KORDI-49]|nr:hypothetical protein KR49_13505 [Synechococcus sp. KORDI-49]